MHLLRRPAAAQALADDVEEHAEGQLGVLAALDDLRCDDAVFEPDEAVPVGAEPHHRAFLVVAEQADQALQRGAEGGRRDRRVAPHAEVAGLETVAEPQAEIVVAGQARGFLEQVDKGAEAELQGRRAGKIRQDMGVSEDAVDVAAALLDVAADAGGGRGENAGNLAPAAPAARLRRGHIHPSRPLRARSRADPRADACMCRASNQGRPRGVGDPGCQVSPGECQAAAGGRA